jgi:hypothetical protein
MEPIGAGRDFCCGGKPIPIGADRISKGDDEGSGKDDRIGAGEGPPLET